MPIDDGSVSKPVPSNPKNLRWTKSPICFGNCLILDPFTLSTLNSFRSLRGTWYGLKSFLCYLQQHGVGQKLSRHYWLAKIEQKVVDATLFHTSRQISLHNLDHGSIDQFLQVKLLNWRDRPLLIVSETNLRLNKLQELSMARLHPDFAGPVRLPLATNLGHAILEEC
ncbi:hypothetical protein Taro_010116 [Colocasia esculenta]|uniref:Uncharacterized protein n=1 Tax=Colocasia esculenta TaxID=4460 RepID=A0A843U6T1_COLES|nr:hypothetical protein [Colocasia esculenta]